MSTLELKKVKLEELNEEFRSLKTKISNLISEINLEEEVSELEIGIKETGYLLIVIPDVFNDIWDDGLEDIGYLDKKYEEIGDESFFFFEEEENRQTIISCFVQHLSSDKNEALHHILNIFGGIENFELKEVKKDHISVSFCAPSHQWMDDFSGYSIGISDSEIDNSINLSSCRYLIPEEAKCKLKEGECVYYPNELREDGKFYNIYSLHHVDKSEFEGDWDSCPTTDLKLPTLVLVYKKKE